MTGYGLEAASNSDYAGLPILDPEDSFGVTVRNALQVASGQPRRLQKRYGRRRRLVRVIDRPHDVVDANLVHAETKHQGFSCWESE